MGFLRDSCRVFSSTSEMLKFSCGDKDLDDFFCNDATKYELQLLGKTYFFRLKHDDSVVVCAFTLSNSSIDARKLPNNRKRKLTEKIPHEKNLSSYPCSERALSIPQGNTLCTMPSSWVSGCKPEIKMIAPLQG